MGVELQLAADGTSRRSVSPLKLAFADADDLLKLVPSAIIAPAEARLADRKRLTTRLVQEAE